MRQAGGPLGVACRTRIRFAAVSQAKPLIDVRLVDHPVRAIDHAPLPPGAGGECIFLGRTRLDHDPEHGALRRLSYEAYGEMALRVLTALANEASSRFGCLAVRVHHALGEVPVGEASVLVQVACGHRDQAFAACRFLIDRLKTDAPIWKREVWERGESWSPSAAVPTPGDGGGAEVR